MIKTKSITFSIHTNFGRYEYNAGCKIKKKDFGIIPGSNDAFSNLLNMVACCLALLFTKLHKNQVCTRPAVNLILKKRKNTTSDYGQIELSKKKNLESGIVCRSVGEGTGANFL